MSRIITFYSYKGGVGRSQAMANIAVLMAQWGYKTLVIDWDLEAPGLENFYAPYLDMKEVKAKEGLIDILSGTENASVRWQKCLVPIEIKGEVEPGMLHMITAGNRQKNYYERVRAFEVKHFYEQNNGGQLIEELRQEWKEAYDFVLIDSRTGITDIGGICTIQLPDIMVLLFTATDQGLNGIIDVAEKALNAQQNLPFDRLNLLFLPIPTRFDKNTEFEIAETWLKKFEERFTFIYSKWLPKSVNRYNFITNTKVPYIPYFSFGERLAITGGGVTDPAGMGYAYQTIAALLATNLEDSEDLLENRDKLLRKANKKLHSVEELLTHDSPDTRNVGYQLASVPAKPFYKRPLVVLGIVLLVFLSAYFGNSIINKPAAADFKIDSLRKDSLKKGQEKLRYGQALLTAMFNHDSLAAVVVYDEFQKQFPGDTALKENASTIELMREIMSQKVDSVKDAFYEDMTKLRLRQNYFTQRIYRFESLDQPTFGVIQESIQMMEKQTMGHRSLYEVYKDSIKLSFGPDGYILEYMENSIVHEPERKMYKQRNRPAKLELNKDFKIVWYSAEIETYKTYYEKVDINVFYYKGSEKQGSRKIGQEIVESLNRFPGHRAKLEPLSVSTNSKPGYQLEGPEIRCNVDERELARQLKMNVESFPVTVSGGLNFKLVTSKIRTPEISLFVFIPKKGAKGP